MKSYRVTELLGDGISTELAQSVHQVLASLPVKIELEPVDLSLPARQGDQAACYEHALKSLKRTSVALKYPTITEGESPNKILRERCGFAVIHRSCATIPGIATYFTKPIDVDIVRVATGGTYEDQGRRIGLHSAVSVRVIEKLPCLLAAKFAFRLAKEKGKSVISSSKYTIQRATDGLFEEAVDEAATAYPSVKHKRILFDALLAKLATHPEEVQVVVCPNEYGDFLSDCAAGLVGSLGVADSASYAFDDKGDVAVALFDPAGGTAPDIAGKNLVNPSAIFLALSALLAHIGEEKIGRRLRLAVMDCLAQGRTTRDLGGKLGTDAFTQAVIEGFRSERKTSEAAC
ncbi:MAG: isocitrate dehydrogenase [Elusimicrobia bacterium]|nr:isocitrate dehydrogenase [Elusimicrobiota bacterium]